MGKTSIQELSAFGQSAWVDNISRPMIKSGRLNEMIALGLRGMTSNPTIFDKVITSGTDYDDKILELSKAGKSTFEIYDELTIRDIQDAADIFFPVYEESSGVDGYVSLEINPRLAYKTDETIKEGIRLFEKVRRPNVMFKVPAAFEGFKAIEELLSYGINVNSTLLFSSEQYVKTARAYIAGVRKFMEKGHFPGNLYSVASVFVSRIDTLVDTLLEEKASGEKDAQLKEKISSLKSKAAVANSKFIYHKYNEIFSSDEFKALKEKGANPQRVLWGSTSTKNPEYSDIKYVSELIAKDTVNTMPENTFNAFLDHGLVKEAFTLDDSSARKGIDELEAAGIDIKSVCNNLFKDGVKVFENSFNSLLESLEAKVKVLGKIIP